MNFQDLLTNSIKNLGNRVANQPVIPLIPQTSLSNLFTRPPSGLDPGSLYGAYKQDPKQATMNAIVGLTAAPMSSAENIHGVIDNIPIKKQLGLSPQDSIIESKFAKDIMSNLESMYAKSKEMFGNVINTDNMRELSTDYSATKQSRSALSKAVHEPASAMAKYSYKKALQDPKADVIYGTAGGTGSGKSVGSNNLPKVLDGTAYLYDTNMNNFKSASEKIDQALKAGKKFDLRYTLADPITALDRALGRADRMGRTVPLKDHLETHVGALDTIKDLYYKYKDNPNVSIKIIDNTGAKGSQHEIPFDKIKNMSYNRKALEDALKQRLEMLHETGKISDHIYSGTK